MLGALSQRGHLCCLSLWYGLWFSCQDSWPLGPAAPKPPLPCLTSRLLPSACCPQPQCCYPVLPASPLLPSSCQALPALFPCSRAGQLSGPQSCSHIVSRQACPRAGAPQASRAPNAPSRCVQATVPTTAPARSTRATSPSADACPASWGIAASTVSEPSLGPGPG